MNVLYLEPPYSRFFYHLDQALAPAFSHVFLFNLGNWIYFPTARVSFVSKALKSVQVTRASIEKVRKLPSLINSSIRTPTEQEILEMAKFYQFLGDYLVHNKIDHVFCYNDLRWQHAVAKLVCKELKVKALFFEEGYFRPDTITVDRCGLNAYASESLKQVLEGQFLPQRAHCNLKPAFAQSVVKNIQFGLFLVLGWFGDLLAINTLTKNKVFSFYSYARLAFHMLASKIRSNQSKTMAGRYLFVPLQVSTDSQTVVHSPFKNTQAVISFIESAFYAIPSDVRGDLQLVFKKHPMSLSDHYTFDNRSIVSDASTAILIENCEFMVTVNSTVTIEAITALKHTILLGRSIYSLAPLCTYVSSQAELSEQIVRNFGVSVSEADAKSARDFISRLKFQYQLNCNYYNYKKHISEVALWITA